MSALSQEDKRSVTGRNIEFLKKTCQHDIFKEETWRIKHLLPKEDSCKPWRTSLLSTLLKTRRERDFSRLNLTKNQLDEMIYSLRST